MQIYTAFDNFRKSLRNSLKSDRIESIDLNEV